MLEKITKQAVNANNVKSTPGQRLTGTVSENKHVFDKFPELISSALNSIIDALQSVAEGDSGADCINVTPIEGISGTTVQGILGAFKAMIDDVYTKGSVDDKLDEKADKTTVDMSLKEISLDPVTGIWTFIRQNGTSFTIDTLLEKIIVNFRYDKTTQSIIFTASDGTLQPVSLSDFIAETEFANSDTIEISVNDGVVSAHIKEGGISDDLLSSALKSALIGYRDDAQVAARNAAASETNAGQYAASAAASQVVATQKAEDAGNFAGSAEQSAQEADTAATMAKSYAVGGTNSRAGEDADNAKYYKEQAGLSVEAAAGSADIAQKAATTATGKADAAKISENAAKVAAQTAETKATEAEDSATAASSSATSASGYASTAQVKATEAADSATAAAASASSAQSNKTAAVNAKTAAQAAQAAAELARDEAQEIAGGDYATNTSLNNHMQNVDLHFTTGEKAKLLNVPANTNTALSSKVDKVTGKGLSSNDYTDSDKAKVQSALQSVPHANATTYGIVKTVNNVNEFWGSEDTDAVTVGFYKQAADEIEKMISNKADKPAISYMTLSANAWNDKQYSFEDSYPKATYDLSVEPDSTCTEAQLDAWCSARIVGSSTGNVLKAFGDVPTVDIPVILEVKKK
jgi:hypothetical protein